MKHQILIIISVLVLISCSEKTTYIKNRGLIHGTTYSLIYKSKNNKHIEIREVMQMTDSLFSHFKPNSIISQFNKNIKTTNFSKSFMNCINASMDISEATDGSYDPTVSPLVDVWGFGTTKRSNITKKLLDSLMEYVGYKKIVVKGSDIIKTDKRVTINLSAIAKGLSVDRVSDYLEKHGIDNYLVEIGGEIRTRGINAKGKLWTVGIDKPIDDIATTNRELQTIVHLDNISIATSGNYRNFYKKDGQKFSHTIDPKTGDQIKHNLLSVSVFSKNCMIADAYATAFMVMGLEKSYQTALKHPELEAYFIYNNREGALKVKYTKRVERFLKKKE